MTVVAVSDLNEPSDCREGPALEVSKLTALATDAVLAALRGFPARFPGRRLAGYAIGTDDELMSAYGIFADRAYFDSPSYPGAEYLFVEWPLADDRHSLDAVTQALQSLGNEALASGSSERVEQHITTAFACLREALKRGRLECGLDDDVLLLVGSTDPSPFSFQLYLDAAKQLNSPAQYREFVKAQGQLPEGVVP